jgi:hypothetical protein
MVNTTIAAVGRLLGVVVVLLVALGTTARAAGTDASATRAAEASALEVMDAFLAAFNASDVPAWADTLLFPHVRLASGQVRVYPDRQSFIDAMDMQAFAASTGWRHSTWDDMAVVQSSPDKVHIRVRFSRFDADGELIGAYDSLYVIERVDGRWGVRARSSFAP